MKNYCFLETLKLKFPDFENYYTLISDYKGSGKYILIKNKYGICKVLPHNLLKRKLPSIESSINKKEYFINQSKEIHGDKYDYTNTKINKSCDKISIICKIHGEFTQTHNSHLNGSNCNKCSNITANKNSTFTTSKFIEKAKLKHGDLYCYKNTNYVSCYEPLKINCSIHGDFLQKAYLHLYGYGCVDCSNKKMSDFMIENPNGWNYNIWESKAKKSKIFDSFKVYILKCWNDSEEFYKIGKTFVTVKNRYSCKSVLPYNYKIIKIIEGNAREISELENTLKNKNKKHSYLPKITFGGQYECFSEYEL